MPRLVSESIIVIKLVSQNQRRNDKSEDFVFVQIIPNGIDQKSLVEILQRNNDCWLGQSGCEKNRFDGVLKLGGRKPRLFEHSKPTPQDEFGHVIEVVIENRVDPSSTWHGVRGTRHRERPVGEMGLVRRVGGILGEVRIHSIIIMR